MLVFLDPSKCTFNHPYAYSNGGLCCACPREKVNAILGAKCDGSVLSSTSSCCYKDAQYTCLSPPCSSLKGMVFIHICLKSNHYTCMIYLY